MLSSQRKLKTKQSIDNANENYLGINFKILRERRHLSHMMDNANENYLMENGCVGH